MLEVAKSQAVDDGKAHATNGVAYKHWNHAVGNVCPPGQVMGPKNDAHGDEVHCK